MIDIPVTVLLAQLGAGELTPGDPLPGDQDADVASAGAGFTGL